MLFNKKRAYKLMDDYKIDALITSCPENVTYSSGLPRLHGCMSDVLIYVVIPRNEKISPVVIISKNAVDIFLDIDSWIKEVELWGNFYIFESKKINFKELSQLEKVYTKTIREKRTYNNAIEALTKILEEKKLNHARLGVDEKGMSIIDYEKVKDYIPNAKIIPSNHIFQKIRAVKTPEEINRLRKAAFINERGLEVILDNLKEGKTEKQLALIHDEAIRSLGGVPYHDAIQGGTRGSLVNGGVGPSDYIFKKGDPIRLDFDCNYCDYYSDMARTAVIGNPSEKIKKYYNAVMQGVLIAQEKIKPGLPVKELFNTVIESVRENGIKNFNRHHVGHGIGLACYDLPLICANNEMKLEEGMVFNLETPYYEIGFGCMHLENTYLVTKHGYEVLQEMRPELLIIS